MAASANNVLCRNGLEVAASKINNKIQLFSKHQISRDYCTAENLRGIDANLLLNNV